MTFTNQKKQCLAKLDKSRKGSIDKDILNLVTLINDHPHFYTTSSCSGRILLLTTAPQKHEVQWLFTSHDTVTYEDIKPALEKLPNDMVWFRMEAPILHICAKTIEDGELLLKLANDHGFRRSAFLNLHKRTILEILFTEKIDAPIALKGTLIVNEKYLRILINEANERLSTTRDKLHKFEELFTKHLCTSSVQ